MTADEHLNRATDIQISQLRLLVEMADCEDLDHYNELRDKFRILADMFLEELRASRKAQTHRP